MATFGTRIFVRAAREPETNVDAMISQGIHSFY